MLATIFVILVFITEQSVELVSAKAAADETKTGKTCAENEEHSICGQMCEPNCGSVGQLLNPAILCPRLQCVDTVTGLHLPTYLFRFFFYQIQF